MKRTTVLCTAYLSAFVSMSCSQAASHGVNGGAGAPAVRAGGAGASPAIAGSGGSGTDTAGTSAVTAAGSSGAPSDAGGASAGSGAGIVSAGSADAGTSGAGSAGAGGAGSAGAGGAGSAGAGGMSATDIVPALRGFYWEVTCAGGIAVDGHDCPMSDASSTCPVGGIDREKTFPVLGTPGQTYTINIEVRGVVSARCYTGGTRASTAYLNENGDNNWWYRGGVYGDPTGWTNSFELKVSPSAGDVSGDVYYFNGADVQGARVCFQDATYLVNYKANFKAKGGGTLTFKIHDQNCKVQQNCGSDPDQSSPCSPRTVNLVGMPAQPPANFTQPPSNGTYKPQWLLIAVTSVTTP